MDETIGNEPTRAPGRDGDRPRKVGDLSRADTLRPTPPPADTLDGGATLGGGAARDADTLDTGRTRAPGEDRAGRSSVLFAEVAIEWGLLTQEQIDDLRVTFDGLAKLGMRRSFAQIVREKRTLPNEDIRRILQEMRKRGATMRFGGFEILGKLGEGGMGSVYKARQLALDRVVALKTLRREFSADSDFLQRFEREAKLAAQVQHPNALQVYGTGEVDGVYYMAMEYVDGATVSRMLADGPMGERRALGIVRGVASALAVAHDQGIVHRDIKPDNIMVTREGVPKLMDLGIARQYGGGDSITRTGAVVGTPHYMSPEQCEGKADLDARSDIYSLGATLFHMVCGRYLYDGETTQAIMRQHIDAPLPDPKSLNPDLSDGIVDLLRRMLAKRPEDRPRDCAELLATIEPEALQGREPEVARPTEPRGLRGREPEVAGPTERSEGEAEKRFMSPQPGPVAVVAVHSSFRIHHSSVRRTQP